MPPAKPEAFPFDAVHDLIGVCRAMALATPVSARHRRRRLREIGASLLRALDLAYAHDDDRASAPYRAAWSEALAATQRLGDEVEAMMPAGPLLAAEDVAPPRRRKQRLG